MFSLTLQRRRAPETEESYMSKELRVITADDLRQNPSLVAEIRAGATDIVERRTASTTAEVRAASNGGFTIVGHGAVFSPEVSEPLGGFRETIARGAFRKVLAQSGLDVLGLWDHDASRLLARTTNGTLKLREDPTGLYYEMQVPGGVSYAEDLRILIEGGFITKSSFAFRVSDGQSWSEDPETGELLRTITQFDSLADVAVVGQPAYRGTDASVERDLPADMESAAPDSSNHQQEQSVAGSAVQLDAGPVGDARQRDESQLPARQSPEWWKAHIRLNRGV
jgi:uncharacterized protein